MRSPWLSQVGAILWKEAVSELRGRHGLFTSAMFGLLTVVVLVFASFTEKPSASMVAAMLTSALVFSAVVTLPRSMIAEDEQGTFALLVLLAEPGAAFFGKTLMNCLQMLIGATVLTVVYLTMSEVVVASLPMFSVALLTLALSLAVGVSLCGALVLGSTNRWLLASVVSLPLLIPVVFLGVVAVKSGVDGSGMETGRQCVVALVGYFATILGAGPGLIAKVWGND